MLKQQLLIAFQVIHSFVQSLNLYMISFLGHQNVNEGRFMGVIEGLKGVDTCQFVQTIILPQNRLQQ